MGLFPFVGRSGRATLFESLDDVSEGRTQPVEEPGSSNKNNQTERPCVSHLPPIQLSTPKGDLPKRINDLQNRIPLEKLPDSGCRSLSLFGGVKDPACVKKGQSKKGAQLTDVPYEHPQRGKEPGQPKGHEQDREQNYGHVENAKTQTGSEKKYAYQAQTKTNQQSARIAHTCI